MKKYTLTENGVVDNDSGASIPNAPGNRHWQGYQEWLDEGNTPEPEVTFNEIKESKLREITVARKKVMLEGRPIYYAGNYYQATKESRDNVGDILTALANGSTLPPDFTWRDVDNVRRPFTLTDLQALSDAMLAMTWDFYQTSFDAKDAVEAITVDGTTYTTEEEAKAAVEAITYNP